MNIGILTDTYYPEINGVVTSINLLEKELTKQGHNVYIFTSTDPHADLEAEEGKVFRFRSLPFIFFPERRLAFSGLFKLSKLVKRLELDIIHTHTEFSLGLMGLYVAKKHKLAIIHTYHTMYEDYLHYIGNGKLVKASTVRKVTRLYCNAVDEMIVPSEKAKRALESYGVQTEINIILTGMDFHKFELQKQHLIIFKQLKEEFNITNGPVLLAVGRMSQEKNMDAILRAMPGILKQSPKAKLIVVGDGPMKKELNRLAEKLQIQDSTIFIGAIPWQEINTYYQWSDLFISASTSETQGLTLFEAIASKTPVVVKADPCLDKIVVNGESGFVYQTDDDLAKAVIHALSDEHNLQRIAITAFKKIQYLSAASFADNIMDVYQKVAEKKLELKLQPQVAKRRSPTRWIRSLFMIGK